MQRIRILIADDHELVRMALRTLLEAEQGLDIIGEAHDTESAIAQTLSLAPDVLLLDLRMPGAGGVEVCERVKAALPETAVLVITSFDDDEELFGALDAGADGYLMKGTRPDRVAHAVRAVFCGQTVLDPEIALRVSGGRGEQVQAGNANDGLASPLSDRELEVLALMARGQSNKQIARELVIGENTVKTHVSHILRKLDQSDRTCAVVAALRMGLVTLEPDAGTS